MNDKEKASALLQFMEDEWDGKAIINALNPYLKDEDLAGLYDKLQKDGVIRDEDPDDDVPEGLRGALAYVRENMDEDDLAMLRAEVNKCYKSHIIPSESVVDCSTLIDLLEEYGEEHDLGEGWWMEECDMDGIVLLIAHWS